MLAAGCEFFATFFLSDFKDNGTLAVNVGGVSAVAFKAVLSYLYEGTCAIEEAALPSIIAAAAQLQARLLAPT